MEEADKEWMWASEELRVDCKDLERKIYEEEIIDRNKIDEAIVETKKNLVSYF